MPEALFLVDADDAGAAVLARAFRRHAWRCRLCDLRFARPTLDGSGEVPFVVMDGVPVSPEVVVNRSATTTFSAPPASALDRQLPTTWTGRYLAAREEQGLLLACLDLWERATRVYNPVRALDRRLLGPAVEAELRAGDVPLGRAGDGEGRRGACFVLDGEVVAAFARRSGGWAPATVSEETAGLVGRCAALTDLRLGQVDLWQRREGTTLVTGWQPQPRFHRIWQQTDVDVAGLAVAAIVGDEPRTAPAFLASDLEANLLDRLG